MSDSGNERDQDIAQRSLNLPKARVRQDNRLISAAYRLSLPEKRILSLAMARMVHDNLLDLQVPPYIRISTEDYARVYLRKLLQENRRDALRVAHKTMERSSALLYQRSFQTRERLKFGAYDEGELYSISARFLQEHGTNAKTFGGAGGKAKTGFADGKLIIRFSQQVHDYLVKESRDHGFTLYTLEQIANLESFYACRLYEIASQFAAVGRRSNIPAQSMRELILGPDDESYATPKDFNRYVVKKAVQEVSEKTDLTVRIDSLKEGSKIVAYNLIVNRKKTDAHEDDDAADIELTSNADFYKEVGLYPDEEPVSKAGTEAPHAEGMPVNHTHVQPGPFASWEVLFQTLACQPQHKIQDARAQAMFMEWRQMDATDEAVQNGILMATQYALSNGQMINGMKYYDRFVRQAVAQVKYQEMIRLQEMQGVQPAQISALPMQQAFQGNVYSQRPASPTQRRNQMVSEMVMGPLIDPNNDDW
jgi:hypothetical protein